MRSIIRTSLLLAGALLVCAGAASASTTLEVKVPFSFVVKGTTLPAGQYRVEWEDSSTLLFIGEKGTHGRAFVMTMPGEQPGTAPILSFTRFEKNQYRLSAVEGQEVVAVKSHS